MEKELVARASDSAVLAGTPVLVTPMMVVRRLLVAGYLESVFLPDGVELPHAGVDAHDRLPVAHFRNLARLGCSCGATIAEEIAVVVRRCLLREQVRFEGREGRPALVPVAKLALLLLSEHAL